MTDYIEAGQQWTNADTVDKVCPTTGVTLKAGCTYTWDGDSWEIDAASQARLDAASVLADMTAISDDGKIDKSERPKVFADWQKIYTSYNINQPDAAGRGISTTNYTTAFNALSTYLVGLGVPNPPTDSAGATWIQNASTITIDRTTFRSKFNDYFQQEDLLMTQITAAVDSKATNAVTDASNALTYAADALGATTAIEGKINTIQSDNAIDASEKSYVFARWKDIYIEKPKWEAQAASFNVTTEKTDYVNAYNTLKNYLIASPISIQNPPTDGILWVADSNPISITGSDFRAKFNAYYDKRDTLINKLLEVSKATADAAQQTATDAASKAGSVVTSVDSKSNYSNNSGTIQVSRTRQVNPEKLYFRSVVTSQYADHQTDRSIEWYLSINPTTQLLWHLETNMLDPDGNPCYSVDISFLGSMVNSYGSLSYAGEYRDSLVVSGFIRGANSPSHNVPFQTFTFPLIKAEANNLVADLKITEYIDLTFDLKGNIVVPGTAYLAGSLGPFYLNVGEIDQSSGAFNTYSGNFTDVDRSFTAGPGITVMDAYGLGTSLHGAALITSIPNTVKTGDLLVECKAAVTGKNFATKFLARRADIPQTSTDFPDSANIQNANIAVGVTSTPPANPTKGQNYTDPATNIHYVCYTDGTWTSVANQTKFASGTLYPLSSTDRASIPEDVNEYFNTGSSPNVAGLYKKDGGVWRKVSTATAKKFKSNNSPHLIETLSIGDVWLNTSSTQTVLGVSIPAGSLSVWDGSAWDVITGLVLSGLSDPISTQGKVGDEYINTTTNVHFRKSDSTTWVALANLLTQSTQLTDSANIQNANLSRGSASSANIPTNPTVGQYYFNTSDNKFYTCLSAGAWTPSASHNIFYNQTTTPTATVGAVWYNPNNAILYTCYTAGSWTSSANYLTTSTQLSDSSNIQNGNIYLSSGGIYGIGTGAGTVIDNNHSGIQGQISTAGTTATWSGVSGTGKPANDANKTYVDGNGIIQGVSSGAGTLVDNGKMYLGYLSYFPSAVNGNFFRYSGDNKLYIYNNGWSVVATTNEGPFAVLPGKLSSSNIFSNVETEAVSVSTNGSSSTGNLGSYNYLTTLVGNSAGPMRYIINATATLAVDAGGSGQINLVITNSQSSIVADSGTSRFSVTGGATYTSGSVSCTVAVQVPAGNNYYLYHYPVVNNVVGWFSNINYTKIGILV